MHFFGERDPYKITLVGDTFTNEWVAGAMKLKQSDDNYVFADYLQNGDSSMRNQQINLRDSV